MNRMLLPNSIFLICFFSIFFSDLLACEETRADKSNNNSESVTKVLLLGASVGQEWHVDALPERIQDNSFQYEFIAKFDPDKSDIIDQALSRKENKPNVIILKQCAAYIRSDIAVFDPKHVEHYKRLADSFVKKCRKNDVIPILATVVPISEKMPFMVKMKRAIKKYVLQKNISPYHRKVRLEGILDYNDWVRTYAKENGLEVLDLEIPLRVSDQNRWLNHDFTTDGLHINKKAYRRLDPILNDTIKKAINY